jgi:hypothetical protein
MYDICPCGVVETKQFNPNTNGADSVGYEFL